MANEVMTVQQWEGPFPPVDHRYSRLMQILAPPSRVQVRVEVRLPEVWPSLIAPHVHGTEMVARVGRWYVTPDGLRCADEHYTIGQERLDEDSLLAALLGESWFYDPTDFLDAYEAARSFHDHTASQS